MSSLASVVPKFARRWVGYARDTGALLRGWRCYRRTGVTPDEAYQAMIRLYCRTGGWSNDVLHGLVRRVNPPYPTPEADGILGKLTETDVSRAVSEVRNKGYYIFEQLLPQVICDRLTEFALNVPLIPIFPDGPGGERVLYNRSKPIAHTCKFREEDLLPNEDVQGLLSDASMLAVAQAYLGSRPVLDIVAMWWSGAFSEEASSEAAQLYHFDMDRIKWLKFFFYLTDVTPTSGPHCFIAGTNRTGASAAPLLARGYSRIPDEDMARHYPPEAFVEITGPRGSIIAVDTRGFHKGKPPESGDRLILQLEFCDSLFGKPLERTFVDQAPSPLLQTRAAQFHGVYAKYVFDGRNGVPS